MMYQTELQRFISNKTSISQYSDKQKGPTTMYENLNQYSYYKLSSTKEN
jgi:hypothetical protein